jgi:hypothetical protein
MRKLRIAALTVFVCEIALWIADRIAAAITLPMQFVGFPADGPFQTFNPLRRLAAGQHAGVDFQFFHGLGLPYLLYPLFALGGKTIFASEVSRELVSVLFFALTLIAIIAAASRDLAITIVATAGAFAMSWPFQYLAVGGISLLGLRSTAPLLLVVVLLLPWRDVPRFAASAAVIAAAFALSSEQGIAIVVAFGAMQMLLAVKRRTPRPLAHAAVSIASGLAGYIGFLLIVGGPAGCRNALRYAFRDVPADQFWYFGSPPNRFFSEWFDVFSDSFWTPWFAISLILTLCVVFVFWRARDERDQRVLHAVAVLLIYGLLSSAAYFGYIFWGNAIPMLRATFLAVVVLAAYGCAAYRHRVDPRLRSVGVAAVYLFVALLVAADAVETIADLQSLVLPRYRIFVEHGRRWELSPRWQWDMAISRRLLGSPAAGVKPRIWCTFAGLVDADYGTFNPSFDYIFHALGDENRRAYINTFRRTKPDYVETLRPSVVGYELWLREAHWDFYSELLHNYEPAAMTTHSLWWKRGRVTPLVEHDGGAVTIGPEGTLTALVLPHFDTRVGIAVVTLRYRLTNPWKRVPVVGQLPRHLFLIDGALNRDAVALAPYRTEAQVPIFVRNGQRPSIGVITESLVPNASVTVLGATVKLIELDDRTRRFLNNPSVNDHVPPQVRHDFR